MSLCVFAVLAFLPALQAEETAPKASPTTNSAEEEQAPTLWSFAWVTDMHMNASRVKYLTGAMRHIDTKLQPHFVMITGDNNYNPAKPVKKGESKGLRRQRFFKQFLDKYLKTPWVVIPGDDWPWEFDKVFGPKQYSFDCGGIHFLFLAPDRVYQTKSMEGLCVFEKSTWTWIRKDLDANRKKPTIVVIHEPIYPLTFLDSPPLRKLLTEYPNVFAVLQGHLHMDMEHRKDGRCYLVGPSLSEPPTPGMKLVNVTPTALIVRTILYNKKTKQFEMQPRRQAVEIPVDLRGGLTRPKDKKFVKANYKCIPAKPLLSDPSLEKRKGEIIRNSLMNLYSGK